MAFIFIGILVDFTVSSFGFHHVKLPWLHCQWLMSSSSFDLNPLD